VRIAPLAPGETERVLAAYRALGYRDRGLPPKRVTGTVQIRTGPIEVNDTLLTWEKAVDSESSRSS